MALLLAAGLGSVLALRGILYRQLDGTLRHLAEVEAQAGAAASGPDFQFHEGVLLAAREAPSGELTRYAQLWTHDGQPLVRSRNLSADLELPPETQAEAGGGRIATVTQTWRGREIRSVVYPLELVGAAHQVHLLQVPAPTEPVRQTLTRFSAFLVVLIVAGILLAYGLGR